MRFHSLDFRISQTNNVIMTLIKCIKCGQMVSDKGSKCPKCGTPIRMIKEAAKPVEKEEKVIAEVESPKTEVPKVEAAPSIDELSDEPKSSKKSIVAVVCGIVAIAIIGTSYYLWQNHRTDGTEIVPPMLKCWIPHKSRKPLQMK